MASVNNSSSASTTGATSQCQFTARPVILYHCDCCHHGRTPCTTTCTAGNHRNSGGSRAQSMPRSKSASKQHDVFLPNKHHRHRQRGFAGLLAQQHQGAPYQVSTAATGTMTLPTDRIITSMATTTHQPPPPPNSQSAAALLASHWQSTPHLTSSPSGNLSSEAFDPLLDAHHMSRGDGYEYFRRHPTATAAMPQRNNFGEDSVSGSVDSVVVEPTTTTIHPRSSSSSCVNCRSLMSENRALKVENDYLRSRRQLTEKQIRNLRGMLANVEAVAATTAAEAEKEPHTTEIRLREDLDLLLKENVLLESYLRERKHIYLEERSLLLRLEKAVVDFLSEESSLDKEAEQRQVHLIGHLQEELAKERRLRSETVTDTEVRLIAENANLLANLRARDTQLAQLTCDKRRLEEDCRQMQLQCDELRNQTAEQQLPDLLKLTQLLMEDPSKGVSELQLTLGSRWLQLPESVMQTVASADDIREHLRDQEDLEDPDEMLQCLWHRHQCAMKLLTQLSRQLKSIGIEEAEQWETLREIDKLLEEKDTEIEALKEELQTHSLQMQELRRNLQEKMELFTFEKNSTKLELEGLQTLMEASNSSSNPQRGGGHSANPNASRKHLLDTVEALRRAYDYLDLAEENRQLHSTLMLMREACAMSAENLQDLDALLMESNADRLRQKCFALMKLMKQQNQSNSQEEGDKKSADATLDARPDTQQQQQLALELDSFKLKVERLSRDNDQLKVLLDKEKRKSKQQNPSKAFGMEAAHSQKSLLNAKKVTVAKKDTGVSGGGGGGGGCDSFTSIHKASVQVMTDLQRSISSLQNHSVLDLDPILNQLQMLQRFVEQEYDLHRDQLARALEELSHEREARDALSEKRAALQIAYDELEALLQPLKDENAHLRVQMETIDVQAKQIKQLKQRHSAEKQSMLMELGRLEAANKTLSEARDNLKEDIALTEHKLLLQQQEAECLRGSWEEADRSANAEVEKLHLEMTALKQTLEETRREVRVLKNETLNLHEALRVSHEENNARLHEVHGLQSRLNAEVAAVAKLSNRLIELSGQLQSVKKKSNTHQEDNERALANTRRRLRDLQAEYKRLQGENVQLRQQHADWSKQHWQEAEALFTRERSLLVTARARCESLEEEVDWLRSQLHHEKTRRAAGGTTGANCCSHSALKQADSWREDEIKRLIDQSQAKAHILVNGGSQQGLSLTSLHARSNSSPGPIRFTESEA